MSSPRWSATARELLFVSGQLGSVGRHLWSAPFSVVGDAFVPGTPQRWSPASIRSLGPPSPYDLHPDGQRVAASALQEQAGVQDKVVVMSQFFDYLRTIAPAKE
jgi:hypothetical protein